MNKGVATPVDFVSYAKKFHKSYILETYMKTKSGFQIKVNLQTF